MVTLSSLEDWRFFVSYLKKSKIQPKRSPTILYAAEVSLSDFSDLHRTCLVARLT